MTRPIGALWSKKRYSYGRGLAMTKARGHQYQGSTKCDKTCITSPSKCFQRAFSFLNFFLGAKVKYSISRGYVKHFIWLVRLRWEDKQVTVFFSPPWISASPAEGLLKPNSILKVGDSQWGRIFSQLRHHGFHQQTQRTLAVHSPTSVKRGLPRVMTSLVFLSSLQTAGGKGKGKPHFCL